MASGWQEFNDIITLPTGATTGERIVINGITGEILFYDDNGILRQKLFAGDPTGTNVYYPNGVIKMSIDTDGVKIYDTSGALRIWMNGGADGYIYFYSLNPAETNPARIRCYTQSGYGRMEIVGPELTNHFPANIYLDSETVSVSGAVHVGNASLEAPAGNTTVNARDDILIAAGTDGSGQVTLQSPSLVTVNSFFSVQTGFACYFPETNIYNTLGMHANGQIVLDSGSWIKRGSLANMTLINGWNNFGGGFRNGSYAELPDRKGVAFGVINYGGGSNTFWTIPAALVPTANECFIVGGNGGRKAQVVISSGGTAFMQNADAGTTWISLAGVTWPMNGF